MIYQVDYTKEFKKQYKKLEKQGKDLTKLYSVIETLSTGFESDKKYKNHKLLKNKIYRDCMECHIEPDWLLVYRIDKINLILLLYSTGSHSDLF